MKTLFVYHTLFLTIGATICLYGETWASAGTLLPPTKHSFEDNRLQIRDETVCQSQTHSSCKATDFSYLICPASEEGKNYTEYSCPILFKDNETFAICSNKVFTSVDDIRIPANTTVLCLQDNPVLSEIGPESFKQYPEIKHLNLQKCTGISKISETAFKGLDKLVWLSLDNITVPDIPNKTFSFLPKLMRLGLSFWNPEGQTIEEREEQLKLNCLQGLNETQISDVDLRGVNPETANGVFWELKAPLFSVFKDTNLKCLALMHNQIIAIRKNVLNNFLTLEYLWIAYNLLMGSDVQVILFDFGKMENLVFADMSHQTFVPLKFQRFSDSVVESNRFGSPAKFHQVIEKGLESKLFVDLNTSNTFFIKLPPKLKILLAGYYQIVTRSSHFRNSWVQFKPNNVEQLCLPSLSVTETRISHVKNFNKLKVLNLDGAKTFVHNLTLFENVPSLEYLNLANFNMYYYLTNETEWNNFALSMNMPNLTHLDMSRNYLKMNKTSARFFNKFPLLQKLDLGHNLFNIIPVNISNLTNLRYLGLESNTFFTIPRGVINEWAQFGKYHQKNNLTINLTGNTLYCSCADIDTINNAAHIQNIKLEGYVCLFPSGEKLGLFQVNMKEMESKCGKNWLFFHMYIVYICYLIIMMAYIIPIICYRFRHTLMYMWYLYKYYMKKRVSMDMDESKYEYDAYFICHPDDLVHIGPLYKTLEKVYGYKLYILERDGLGGNTLLNIIKHSFTLCRNAILIISEKSMKGQCFHYVIHLAKEISDTRNAKIVCILLNTKYILKSPAITGSLEYLLCTSLCLPWEAKHSNRPVFWMRLRNHLGIPSQHV